MLNIMTGTMQVGTRWECLQQPVHGSPHAADYLRILAALDEGWQIVEAADILAHGSNAEGRGYVITLMHSRRMLTREWNIMRSPEVDMLLVHEHVPMAS